MNTHYFKLKCFLEELEQHLETAINIECQVLHSESNTLYGENKNLTIINPSQYMTNFSRQG